MSQESRQRVLEWDSKLDRLNYEQVLAVPDDASIESCREAYYRFARAFHPDAHVGADATMLAALTRIFQRGAEAYRVLTDPVLRARWNIAKRSGASRLRESSRAPSFDVRSELSSLHPHCRSAGAKLCAQQAANLFSKERLEACADQLRNALLYEGGANPYVARCLEAVELESAQRGSHDSNH